MKIFFKLKQNMGFSLIEILVAVSVFLIVVTMGISALLNALNVHERIRSDSSLLNNVSFIMDDMVNNLRTGYDYYCILGFNNGNHQMPTSCPDGGDTIFFKPAGFLSGNGNGNEDLLGYYFDGTNINKVANVKNFTILNPPEVRFDPIKPFTVLGAEPGDNRQPFVIIRLSGTVTTDNGTIPFHFETAVSQRIIECRDNSSTDPQDPTNTCADGLRRPKFQNL